MADQTTYLTQEGKKKLEDELQALKTTKRDEIAARLRDAILAGDISENADYDSAKEDQAFMEGRIIEIENILRNVTLIEDMDREKGVVDIGSVVTLKFIDDDETEDFTIVGTHEANPNENKISFQSPIGEAIFKQKQGKTVEVQSPNGPFKVKIVKVK